MVCLTAAFAPLLVTKILSQVSTFLGRAQSRVKWIPKQHVLALVPSPFHITQLKLWCQYFWVKVGVV